MQIKLRTVAVSSPRARPVRPSSLFLLSFLLEILEPTGSSFLILFLRRFLLVTFIFFCFDYLALDICYSRFLRLSSHLFDRFVILRALHRFGHFLLQLSPFYSHFFIHLVQREEQQQHGTSIQRHKYRGWALSTEGHI